MHLGLLRICHGFPGIEQRTKTGLHSLIGLGDAGTHSARHRGLKPAQEIFLLRSNLLSQVSPGSFQMRPGLLDRFLSFDLEAAKFLACVALNFIDECGGSRVSGFAEGNLGALKSLSTWEGD